MSASTSRPACVSATAASTSRNRRTCSSTKNKDDHADGDPEVLLSGFGMQDAHAFPNSLQWGPDGWLYGAQGSTVTSKVRGIEFQQGIWRFHPRTKQFELFAEGGGNTWGLDFDRHGNAIAGTNFGGVAMLHQVQGGYYVKGSRKHGPLHNPNTYGYFEHVPYQNFKGGHVTCGGIVYQGGSYPAKYNDQYIACNPLSNALFWHVLEPKGSSFTARHGGDFLVGNDTWFRPVDCSDRPRRLRLRRRLVRQAHRPRRPASTTGIRQTGGFTRSNTSAAASRER